MIYRVSHLVCDSELKHYGVAGMKWGVRNYQNPDGTWTEEGKRRRNRILNDPGRLSRHYDEFSKQEVDNAIRRQDQIQHLKDLEVRKIKRGKEKADAILSYAKLAGVSIGVLGVGVATYKLASSPGAIKGAGDLVAAGQLAVEGITGKLSTLIKK